MFNKIKDLLILYPFRSRQRRILDIQEDILDAREQLVFDLINTMKFKATVYRLNERLTKISNKQRSEYKKLEPRLQTIVLAEDINIIDNKQLSLVL